MLTLAASSGCAPSSFNFIAKNDGTTGHHTGHNHVAEHFYQVYKEIYNTPDSPETTVEDFMKNDITRLGKMPASTAKKAARPIRKPELMATIKELRQEAKGGPDGVTNRLLTALATQCPNLIIGTTNAVLNGATKPEKLGLRNLIFLLKPGTTKSCIKAFRPISLISSLLKLASKILAKQIETALTKSG